MAAYQYYLVESTYLVRWDDEGAEFVKPDGTWHPYKDTWDVATNGHFITDDEDEAMERAAELFARLDKISFQYR